MAELYAFDSNIYIRAFRDPRTLAILKHALLRLGMRVRFHAVVALELRAGAHTTEQEDAVEALIKPYSERHRMLIPSAGAYVQGGRILSALFRAERMAPAYAPRSLAYDALIAASCREQDAVLVTENAKDFTAIRRHCRGFRFTDLSSLTAGRAP